MNFEFEETKILIRAVLITDFLGMREERFRRIYNELVGSDIDLPKFGFSDMLSLMKSIPTHVSVQVILLFIHFNFPQILNTILNKISIPVLQ